jgi:hypothetical protein
MATDKKQFNLGTLTGSLRHRLLRTYCFYKSNTMYQGVLGGLGHGDAKGDLGGLEGRGESALGMA